MCSVLESYEYRLPDREVNVTARSVAVLPCAAASRSIPPAVSQFEFNGARLRMTGELIVDNNLVVAIVEKTSSHNSPIFGKLGRNKSGY
jgi:hypothetical protein